MDWHAELVQALAVQEIDRRLDALRQEREVLVRNPREGELRREAAAREARVASLQADLQVAGGQQRRAELERATLIAERDRDRNRLFGGQVHHPRELEGLQHNIDGADKRIDELETSILEAMERCGQLQERVEAARGRLDRLAKELAAHQREQRERLQAVDAELPPLTAERERRAAKMDPAVRREYERLRGGARGIAVSEVVSDSCSACGVGLSTLARSRLQDRSRAVTCENCGRLLVEA